MDHNQDPKEVHTAAVKDAVGWLLLAYSLGHGDTCDCERCPAARKIAFAYRKNTAAA